MWATFERFKIEITKNQAHTGSHQGQCDDDVEYLLTVPKIRRQLDKLVPGDWFAELYEYGAWDTEELRDNDANKRRILWIACGNIVEDL